MKIRIKGNSIRLRLSRTDLVTLEENKAVVETTSFGNDLFVYELVPTKDFESLRAVFQNNTISIYIPIRFSSVWNNNDIISLDTRQSIGDDQFLLLLVEKDFQCLDKSMEDQSDFFINPNKTCS